MSNEANDHTEWVHRGHFSRITVHTDEDSAGSESRNTFRHISGVRTDVGRVFREATSRGALVGDLRCSARKGEFERHRESNTNRDL